MEPEELFARMTNFIGRAHVCFEANDKTACMAYICLAYSTNRMLIETIYETLDFEEIANLPDIKIEP